MLTPSSCQTLVKTICLRQCFWLVLGRPTTWFSSVLRTKWWYTSSSLNYVTTASFHTFSIHFLYCVNIRLYSRRCHFPEDSNNYSHCRQRIKSRKIMISCKRNYSYFENPRFIIFIWKQLAFQFQSIYSQRTSFKNILMFFPHLRIDFQMAFSHDM
jgi:hypothetical protein